MSFPHSSFVPSTLYGLGWHMEKGLNLSCLIVEVYSDVVEPCMVESSLEDIVDKGGSSGKAGNTLYGATEKAWGLVSCRIIMAHDGGTKWCGNAMKLK